MRTVAAAATLAGFHAFAMNPIYRITYQRPWGQCVINTAQFASEDDLRVRFAKSYAGCELLKVQDVTKEYLPNS